MQSYESIVNFIRENDVAVHDRRLQDIRPIDSRFQFPRGTSKEAWAKRRAEVKTHILVSAGLWPFPEREPLKTEIFGTMEREDYIVENVYFQSLEGFYVTGNLYRPKGRSGSLPAILNPHGHWAKGRFEHSDYASIPARCINFAKQGYVAFSYDMVGYNDSLQLPHNHRLIGYHEELWGVSLLGLQLWNSIRSLDFLESLSCVDRERIGCTGASGGGTQTFLLSAVDERVRVCAPVNMISSRMEGGCTCENAPGLRVDTSNVEIAALIAPRPMLIVCCTADWTKNFSTEDYPDVQYVYRLFDAEERVNCRLFEEPYHNYNKRSREAVYGWFGRWLLGEDDRELAEKDVTVEEEETRRVFAGGILPSGFPRGEEMISSIVKSRDEHMNTLFHQALQEVSRGENGILYTLYEGYSHTIFPGISGGDDIVVRSSQEDRLGDIAVQQLIIGTERFGEYLPCIFLQPENGTPVVDFIVHSDGKKALVDQKTGKFAPWVYNILDGGRGLFAIDIFLTGEYHLPYQFTGRAPSSRNFFTTFNRTDMMLKIQDIITGYVYLHDVKDMDEIRVTGMKDGGIWTLMASPFLKNIGHLTIDFNHYDIQDDRIFIEHFYVPGIKRIGDLRTAALLQDAKRVTALNLDLGAEYVKDLRAIYRVKGVPFNIGDTDKERGGRGDKEI